MNFQGKVRAVTPQPKAKPGEAHTTSNLRALSGQAPVDYDFANLPLRPNGAWIQRKPAGPDGVAPADVQPTTSLLRGLIAEDDAPNLGPQQMRKSEFLDRLQAEVCAAADAELAAVGRNTEGCPYIENWIGHYRERDSRHLEAAIRRYAPETRNATAARDYIPAVRERIRRAVATWARTGEVTDIPEELLEDLPSLGLAGAVGGFLAGVGGAVSSAVSAVAGAVSDIVSGIGEAISGIGSLFFKTREGGVSPTVPVGSVQSRLGPGRPLDTGVKRRMETAFAHDFSRVRIHTDERAAGLSGQLQARAFTIGDDVAFAHGEYRPETLIGSALLAHELAHVLQQRGGAGASGGGAGDNNAVFEEEADRSAVAAVLSGWQGVKQGFGNVTRSALPSLKSGLRLQRCATVLHKGPVAQGGGVEVRTGELGTQDSIWLEYTGPDAENANWAQFYWSEFISETPSGLIREPGSIHTTSDYRNAPLTTDPSKPRWNIDTQPGSKTPFYPASPSGSGTRLMRDQPDTPLGFGEDLYKKHPDATSVRSLTHFDTYLIRNNQAVYHVLWTITEVFSKSKDSVSKEERRYSVADGGSVQGLPGELLTILNALYPAYENKVH